MNYRIPRDLLFHDFDLYASLEASKQALIAEIGSIEQHRLLNTSSSDLEAYFIDKFSLLPPKLRKELMTASQSETKVDVSGDQNRWIDDRSRPAYVPGQRIDVEIPFEGDGTLFKAKSSTYTVSGTPAGVIKDNFLVLTFQTPSDVERDIRPTLERTISDVEQHLQWVTNDISSFNTQLPTIISRCIAERKERLLRDQGRLAELGIPLKVRADAPATYAAPSIRRKVQPALPAASTDPFHPEPTLTLDHYEHVLGVIQNMTQVMERSPSEFASMGEESLRQHYLVQLNGHFEGNATGETFNASGKTDILLRIDGKNAFIAECKFWKGAKGYADTIDQLLGYSSWRDTKTAILIFNRNRDTSNVLAEVKSTTEAHPNYKKTMPWQHETGYRFLMHHPSDSNRELLMTVMVFDIPEVAKPASAKKATKKNVQ